MEQFGNTPMKAISTVCIFLAFVAGAAAQNTGKAQNSAQPADISGMYTFLRDGEFVQITLEDQGKVTGFISRYGDLASDRGAFLDQFLKNGSLEGAKLTFTSEPLHGVWYDFRGTVARGPAKTPAEEGYYVLKGTLVEHITDANHKETARSREVEFKSFPSDVAPSPAKRD